MVYKDVKIYSDGSHYIGIPHIKQPFKKRKNKPILKNTNENLARQIYRSCKETTKREKIRNATEILGEIIQDKSKSKELIKSVLEKEKKNKIVRLTRLFRKVNLQQWNFFCTFTYDSNKLTEEIFRKKLLNTLRHFSSRRGWKYIGAFEKSPENNRLHFHGIFVIQNMVGNLIETKDYSTTSHKMQKTIQNSFFLEKFGRNDFKSIEVNFETSCAIKYILKYISKSNEKLIYSKHLQTYFVTDVLEEDVICKIGQEDRKILLFDDFKCIDIETGEYFGTISPEVIEKLPKAF